LNEGKKQYGIGKEARISFTDIGVILNKAVEEKSTEGSKEKQDNNGAEKNHLKEHISLSIQACNLFFR
jgi:hypothetical protein